MDKPPVLKSQVVHKNMILNIDERDEVILEAQRDDTCRKIVEWFEGKLNHIGTPLQSTKVEFTGYVAWMSEECWQEFKDILRRSNATDKDR